MLMSSKLPPALAQAPIWDFLRVLILMSASTAVSRWHHLASAWQAAVSERVRRVCTYIVINELLSVIFLPLSHISETKTNQITIRNWKHWKLQPNRESRQKTGNHSRKKRPNPSLLSFKDIVHQLRLLWQLCLSLREPSRWIQSANTLEQPPGKVCAIRMILSGYPPTTSVGQLLGHPESEPNRRFLLAPGKDQQEARVAFPGPPTRGHGTS